MSSPAATGVSLESSPVLVTGATGKVGRRLVTALLTRGASVSVLSRDTGRARTLWPGYAVDLRRGDLTEPASLEGVLDGIRWVFHLASYSPAPDEPDIYEAPAHWLVTAEGTRNLVAAALSSGVERLVYLSSVKAMGDAAGAGDAPADESTPPVPDSLYGRAKLAAEQAVLAAGERGVHVAVLRLPMVYGLSGQGNIARMIEAVARNRFPPWPRIENRRSAIHVDDAVQAALLAASLPQAAGQLYLVSDGGDYSTRRLYELICRALGRDLPRWTVPLWVLASVAAAGSMIEGLSGRAMPLTRTALSKLTGNAWYASEKIRRDLGFSPEHQLETEIEAMVRATIGPGSSD